MEIHFEIENKCLLKCRHCSSYASSQGLEMNYSVENMVSFLNNIEGKKEVFLTGGEPLLYPNFDILLEQLNIKVENIVLGMFSTGIKENNAHIEPISEFYAKRLAQLGLKICYVSIYSFRKEEHDWMTDHAGSFDLTRLSIKNLRKAGIEVRFNTVITAKNNHQIFELIKLAEEWDVAEVRLLKLIRHGRAETCWDTLGIKETQYRQIISSILSRNNPVRITVSGAVDITPCKVYCKENVCPAGKQLWYITYQGDVYPCASAKNNPDYKIGNVKEDIWKKCEAFCRQLDNGFFFCTRY